MIFRKRQVYSISLFVSDSFMRIPRKPPDIQDVLSRHKGALQELFKNSGLIKYTRECEANYWPWDKVRVTAPAAKVNAEIAWSVIKMGRLQRYHWTPLVGTGEQLLRFNVPDSVQRELMLVDQQTAGRLISDDEAPLAPHQRERFIISALREEAIASSMLEGAATTRHDANKMLRSGRKPKTKGERMVTNNYHAIQFIREHRKTPLSVELLLELQSILTKGTQDHENSVGRLRREDENITVVDDRDNAVIHVPPPAHELSDRLERLCTFANQQPQDGEFIHPMIRACILHFQLGFDHPFCDGNGRTARAIFYWSMLRNGYWLFEYLPISRLIYRSPGKYVRAYLNSEIDDFDITYFLTYKTKIISRARQDLRLFLHKKQEQLAEARKLFTKDQRLNHRQREVVLQGARNPDRIFTIADHKERFAVSYATARSDLLQLMDWEYLVADMDSKRYDFRPASKLLGDQMAMAKASRQGFES